MFVQYIEIQLVPALRERDVVILDKLSSHKTLAAMATLRTVGTRFLFLPPYSSTLNPIEWPSPSSKADQEGCRVNLQPTLGRHRTCL